MKRLTMTLGCLFAICSLANGQMTSGIQVVDSSLVFPLQAQHVHGSSMVQLPGGDLLLAWFQGSGERSADDVRILGARLEHGRGQGRRPDRKSGVKGKRG